MSYLKGLAEKVNAVEAKNNFKLMEIDINMLIPSEKNFFGIREIEELAESIKESGLMHNLVVRRTVRGYEILSGERRYHALKSLNYDKIPCQVRTIEDLDAEIVLIKANIEHRELNHTEKMKSINRLKEIYDSKRSAGEEVPKGKTRDLIGKEIGMSGVQVGRYMKVSSKLAEPLKEELDKGSITLTQAETISGLKEHEQLDIHDRIKGNEINRTEVDILVQGIKQPVESKYDKELLHQMNDEKTESEIDKFNNSFEALNKELQIDKNPKVVISNQYFSGIFICNKISVSIKNPGYIEIILKDKESSILAAMSEFKKIKNIPYQGMGLTPKKGYRINDGIFLWFKA